MLGVCLRILTGLLAECFNKKEGKMKKLSVIFLAAAMAAFFVTPGFAMLRKDMQSSKGIVSYINSARTEVTIKDSTTGKDVTFSSVVFITPDIKIGSAVIVLHKTGTTVAKTVRLLPAKRAVSAPQVSAPASGYSAPKSDSYGSYGMPKSTAPAKKSSW